MLMWFLRNIFTIYKLHLRVFVSILCISLLNYYGWTISNLDSLSVFCVTGYDYTQNKE